VVDIELYWHTLFTFGLDLFYRLLLIGDIYLFQVDDRSAIGRWFIFDLCGAKDRHSNLGPGENHIV